MARPDKVQAVAEIKQRFEEADAVFLTEFAGLSVPQQQELRRSLRDGDADYRVLKLTLTRRAIDELGLADLLEELLTGPTALAFTSGDPVPPAKVLEGFAKEHEALLIKGLLMSGELLPPEKVSELAALDPHDVMMGRMAGTLQAPMANLAGLLAAFTRDTASLLSQLLEMKEADAPGSTESDSDPDPDPSPQAGEGEGPDSADGEGAPHPDAAAPAAEGADEDSGNGNAPESTRNSDPHPDLPPQGVEGEDEEE